MEANWTKGWSRKAGGHLPPTLPVVRGLTKELAEGQNPLLGPVPTQAILFSFPLGPQQVLLCAIAVCCARLATAVLSQDMDLCLLLSHPHAAVSPGLPLLHHSPMALATCVHLVSKQEASFLMSSSSPHSAQSPAALSPHEQAHVFPGNGGQDNLHIMVVLVWKVRKSCLTGATGGQ